MSLKSELQEIFEHEFKRNTMGSTERVDKENFMAEVTPKLLDLLDKSLPKELNSFPNERDVDEMAGYNAALADMKKRIHGDV